jgi:hypothetical protein
MPSRRTCRSLMFGNRRAVQGGLHRPPRHPIVGGDLGDGATGVDHRIQQRRSQPGGAASPQRQLVGGRDEGPSSTGRLGTHQPRLAHHHLHPAGVRDIAHPLPHQACTRDDPTPHSGQPESRSTGCTLTRRPPNGRSTASITQYPGKLKITPAASRREPVGSNTARGPSSMDA